MLLCQAECGWRPSRVAQKVVGPADEVAFEAADRLVLGLGALALFDYLERGLRVVEDPAEGDHVDGVVELAVAAVVQAEAISAAGSDRDRDASARVARRCRNGKCR
jgi:hypothetical protein